MSGRERFFEFNWFYLVGLLCAVAGAWITYGPLFVLVTGAIACALIGAYYALWRWLRDRSG